MKTFSDIRIDIKGVDTVINELEKRLGKTRINEITDIALLRGAQIIKRELRKNFELFKDKGHSRDEITISEPMTLNGQRTVVIYWSGPHKRYHIIHFNEFGTVINPRPRGMGAIERSLEQGANEFRKVIGEEIEKELMK